MLQLSTEIVCHERCRIIDCCLCGRSWDEQWVGVSLADGAAVLGNLCPACLSRTPQDISTLFGQYGFTLRAAFPRALEAMEEPNGNVIELGSRVARVRRRMLRLCATARRLVAKSSVLRGELSRRRQEFAETLTERARLIAQAEQLRQQSPPGLPANGADGLADELEETAQEADALLALSEHLGRIARWPISVRAVMYAERAEFLNRFPELGSEYVQRAVDDRYIAFLAGSA